MTAHKFNVAFCFDNNYQQHFGAALTSLLLNFAGNGEDLCIHVVGDALEDASLEKIALLSKRFRAKIRFYAIEDFDQQLLAELPLNSFFTRTTYASILLPHILPQDIESVLYLDSDTIIVSDVSALFEVDLSHKSLAGVSDASCAEMKTHWSIPDYINSGVMLINPLRWRERDYSKKCIDFSHQNKEKLKFLDQCAINVVLQNDIVLLPERWNVMVKPGVSTYSGLDGAILHFITRSKPWQSWYEHPLGENYWKYLNVSPWAGAEPTPAQTVAQTARLARLLTRQGKLKEAIAVYERFQYT